MFTVGFNGRDPNWPDPRGLEKDLSGMKKKVFSSMSKCLTMGVLRL